MVTGIEFYIFLTDFLLITKTIGVSALLMVKVVNWKCWYCCWARNGLYMVATWIWSKLVLPPWTLHKW